MPMPLRRPLSWTTGALAVLVAVAPAAHAAGPDGQAVGGPRLGSSGIVVAAGSPALPEVAAESWLVADLDTGQVLAAKDAHGRYAPASTLKALTALALLPVVESTRRVVPTYDDVAVEGSKVGLAERVAYPAEELYSALLMVSGNDAANALATAAGGQEVTAGLMNTRAQELGALDTVAVNPHGLDAPGQVSSAYDLALFARAGMAVPDFARYVATRSSSVSGPGGQRIEIANKNRLLRGYPGALGIKNGFTTSARASFVGAAERDDRRLVVTLMKADPRVFDEAVKLLDWGFAAPTAAEPVGELVQPVVEAAAEAGAGAEGAALPTVPSSRLLEPPVASASDEPTTGLPVTLAGMALAAAALFTARHRPRPATAHRTSRPARGSRPRSGTTGRSGHGGPAPYPGSPSGRRTPVGARD